jgi:hypothetical protein
MKALVGSSPIEASAVFEMIGFTYVESDWILRDVEDPNIARWPELKPGPWYDAYVVVGRSVSQLREILPLLSLEGSTLVLHVYVERSRQEFREWSQAAGAAGFSWRGLGGEESADSGFLVSWKSSEPANIHDLLVRILTPQNLPTSLPLLGTRLGVATRQASLWAAGDPLARWLGDSTSLQDFEPVESVDIAISSSGLASANDHLSNEWGSDRRTSGILPPVDTVVISPMGFASPPTAGTARLVVSPHAGSWILISDKEESIAQFDALDENVLARMRPFGSIEIDGSNATVPKFRLARLVSQLAIAGVPLSLGKQDSTVSALLGEELESKLNNYGDGRFQSDLQRESLSIDCRREALRRFMPISRWVRAFAAPFVVDESVSIVLPTRRPELLPRILRQIEHQSATDLEVIIGLHGFVGTSPELLALVRSYPFDVRFMSFSDARSLGSVLNELTAAAKGRFITKMDDDDWYAPHHIEDLLLGRSYSGAGLVGAPVEFTYIESADITTQRQFGSECFSDHVAGGTLLLSKELLIGVGGWRTTKAAVDRGLIDGVLASGEHVYRIHGQNYLMHRRWPAAGAMAHTWSAGDETFLRNAINQWDGFSPPPQFGETASWFTPPGRWPGYQSYFEGVSD